MNITNIGIRQMLLASALVMAASGEASAQSASPEQPPSEATHFAQVDSSKLSTALNGKTLIPTIEIGYKASTANPAIINGHPAMFPVKTLIYPDGRENFRIEYGILHADANQHQSFKSGMRFQVTKVIIKDDCLELEIPMFTEGAILDKSFRGDVKFMFGKGWQSSMTTESVLQTVMRYLPDTETIAKAKAEAERVRAEEAEKARIAAETIAKAKAEAERVRAEEAEKARIAAEQPPSEANQAKSNVGGTGTDAGSLEDGLAAEKRGDWKAAFVLLSPLAKQGNPVAELHIGYMWETDKGIQAPDHSPTAMGQTGLTGSQYNASQWYQLSAEQGNANAQVNYGKMQKRVIDYHMKSSGCATIRDDSHPILSALSRLLPPCRDSAGIDWEAEYATGVIPWFRKAADQGDSDGQYMLGYMYYEGKGVPEDYAEAMKWFRKAADQGNADAKVSLKIVERQVEQDKEQAKEQAKEQKAADAYGRTPEGKQQHCQANCNSDKSRCESNNAYDRALLTGSEQGIASGLVLGSIKDCYNEERNCAASCK